MAYQYLPSDLAQLQTQEDENQRRLRQAQILQQAGFNPVQGGNPMLSLITALGSTLAGKRLEAKAGDKASELLAKRFEVENQAQQAKMEAEQRQRDQAYERELNKLREAEKAKAEFRAPRNIDPLSPQGLAAQAQLKRMTGGGAPKQSLEEQMWSLLTPEQRQAAAQAKFTQSGGTNVPSGYRATPEGRLEAIPGGPADKPKEGNPKAAAAQQALEVLGQLEEKLKSGKTWTGPIDKFLPGEGQQSFEATVNGLVNPLQTLTRVPGQGSQSDAELKQLMASFPNLGNRESVNLEAIQRLRDYVAKQQQQLGAQGQPPSSAPPSGAQQEYPDGTVIQNAQGQKMVMQGGQWVPQ